MGRRSNSSTEGVAASTVAMAILLLWAMFISMNTLRGAVVGSERPDLLFPRRFVVAMAGGGLTALIYLLLRLVERRPLRVQVWTAGFTTAFANHAAAAFDVAAVDYLLKPVNAVRLDLAAQRAIDRLQHIRSSVPDEVHIWVPHRGELVRLRSGEIEQVIADRDYVRLQLDNGRTYQLLATIGEMEQRLADASFLRVHRSCLIRTERVAALAQLHVGAWAVRLMSGAEVRVSRSRLTGVRHILGAMGAGGPT